VEISARDGSLPLGLIRTYFLALRPGRIWSSIATSASKTFLRRFSPFMMATLARWLEYLNSFSALATPMRGSCGVAPGSTGGFCCAFKTSPWAAAIAPARAKNDLRETDIGQ